MPSGKTQRRRRNLPSAAIATSRMRATAFALTLLPLAAGVRVPLGLWPTRELQQGLWSMRKAKVLLGGWLAMKLQQGLMPLRKTHVLFGLWPKMKMQRGLRPTRKTQVLLGEWPAMRPHRAQPAPWTCGGRPRAKRRGH